MIQPLLHSSTPREPKFPLKSFIFWHAIFLHNAPHQNFQLPRFSLTNLIIPVHRHVNARIRPTKTTQQQYVPRLCYQIQPSNLGFVFLPQLRLFFQKTSCSRDCSLRPALEDILVSQFDTTVLGVRDSGSNDAPFSSLWSRWIGAMIGGLFLRGGGMVGEVWERADSALVWRARVVCVSFV